MKKEFIEYKAPAMELHFVQCRGVVCQSFGAEGHAGSNIEDGDTYELD